MPVGENGEAGLVAYPGQGVYEFARWGHVAEWLRNGLQNFSVHLSTLQKPLRHNDFLNFELCTLVRCVRFCVRMIRPTPANL